jgi:hypothetical protein
MNKKAGVGDQEKEKPFFKRQIKKIDTNKILWIKSPDAKFNKHYIQGNKKEG